MLFNLIYFDLLKFNHHLIYYHNVLIFDLELLCYILILIFILSLRCFMMDLHRLIELYDQENELLKNYNVILYRELGLDFCCFKLWVSKISMAESIWSWSRLFIRSWIYMFLQGLLRLDKSLSYLGIWSSEIYHRWAREDGLKLIRFRFLNQIWQPPIRL